MTVAMTEIGPKIFQATPLFARCTMESLGGGFWHAFMLGSKLEQRELLAVWFEVSMVDFII
jgi:hypothetical protein